MELTAHSEDWPDTEEHADDFGDVIEPCIAVFDFKDKRVGCAFYRSHTKQLFVATDSEDSFAFDHFKLMRFQIEPDAVLLTSRAQEAFEDHENVLTRVRQEIRPASEFSSRSAVIKLASFVLEDDIVYTFGPELGHQESQRKQANYRLFSQIDGDSSCSLGCANALIIYIERRRSVGNIHPEEYVHEMVGSVKAFAPKHQMLLSEDAFHSLHIFDTERKSKSGDRYQQNEPSSLFDHSNCCRTVEGKMQLRQWFLRPLLNIAHIRERHEAISCFVKAVNVPISREICQNLKKIASMRRSVLRLEQGRYKTGPRCEWQAIVSFSLVCLRIRRLIGDLQIDGQVVVTRKLLSTFEPIQLQTVGSLIADVVDFDESEVEQRVVVKRLVDEQLDEYKLSYDGLEHILTKVCAQLTPIIPAEFVDMVQCIYLPQLGFLVVVTAVKVTAQNEPIRPVWSHQDWEFVFSTESSVYFKSNQMTELDEYFGDIHTLVVDREIELLHQLQVRVLKYSRLLLACSDIIAELDCLLAFAENAKKYDYCQPEMTEGNTIRIIQGRHPMVEAVSSAFIANDTYLRGSDTEFDDEEEASESAIEASLILLTGANFSGKSVYLKQVALLTYMAHLGSYVPAASATIGITDRILTRLQTRESLSKDVSAFMIDLQQVKTALTLMTSRSLLILDEFGKGTDSVDGASLLASTIEFLTRTASGSLRPRVLAATHFHEIFAQGMLETDTPVIALKHMEILVSEPPDTAAEVSYKPGKVSNKAPALAAEHITYLYRLADGASTSSFGINCAAMAGLPHTILARADHLLAISNRGESLVLALAQLSDREKEDLRVAEAVMRRFVAWDVDATDDDALYTKLAQVVTGDQYANK